VSIFHIIDDEPEIREVLKTMAITLGYDVRIFNSADSYIRFINSPDYLAPTAILTDNIMPGTTGYDLITYIRQSNPTQKIAMISGTPDDTHKDSSELCSIIGKPFRMVELDTLLEALMRCHSETLDDQYEKKCKFGLQHHCPLSS